MAKPRILVGILVAFLFMLSACSRPVIALDPSLPAQVSEQSALDSTINKTEKIDIVENTEYYKLTENNNLYYCLIFDESHNVVKSDGPYNSEPNISMANDHLVKFTMSAGPQISTQWGYYYDIKKDVFSRVFYGIYDQSNGRVAYAGKDMVIVRDIFDKTNYYQEISSFKEPLSKVIDPITDVKFTNAGASVEVTYLSGVDYKKVTETINLSKDPPQPKP